MRVLRNSIFIILAALCLATPVLSQTKPDQKPGSDSDVHGLMIYGDGFLFIASEPEGWDADTGDVAQKYHANLVFFPRAKESRAHQLNIRVRLNDKSGENPDDDMAFDMQSYKKRYPKVQFADLKATHASYRTSAKLFLFPDDFYEYVAYVNPGSAWKFSFSVAMSKSKIPATAAELQAFEHVLASLHLASDNLRVEKAQ